MFWKNKKIICGAGAACIVVAGCIAAFCCRGIGNITPHETLPLLETLDSANMMLVTPEGLGDRADGKVVSGRAYRNFVQMLRFVDATESLQDTFKTECTTGLRVQLFRDTLSMAELRIAEKIGYVGNDVGVWQPQDPAVMKKINAFFRSQWVYYRECADGNANATSGSDALNGMILESDTALGMPLVDMLKGVNRVTVYKPGFVPHSELTTFLKAQKEGKKYEMKKESALYAELDSSQIGELLSLLRESKRESYSGNCLCIPHLTVTLFRDTVAIVKLNAVRKDLSRFEKVQQDMDFARGGFWEPANPQVIEAFVKRLSTP